MRLVELGRREIAVGAPGDPGTDHLQQRAVQLGDDDAVVIAVGNEQPARGFIGQDLAGKAQRRVGGRMAFHVEAQRRLVQQLLLPIVGHARADHLVDLLERDLAAGAPDGIAFGINQDHRGPGLHAEQLPQLVVRVVDHRMFDLVALDGRADILRVLLGRELGRMDADDHEVLGPGLLQLVQFGQDVHAVDAAVGPEVEEHELPPQIVQFQRPGRVEPGQIRRQRRDLLSRANGCSMSLAWTVRVAGRVTTDTSSVAARDFTRGSLMGGLPGRLVEKNVREMHVKEIYAAIRNGSTACPASVTNPKPPCSRLDDGLFLDTMAISVIVSVWLANNR